MGSIGNVYQAQRDFAKALEYYFNTLKAFDSLGDKYGVAVGYGNIGETYLIIARDTTGMIKPGELIPAGKTANLHKSVEYLNKAITLFKEIGVLDAIISYSKGLSEAYLLSGDYKGAFESYKQYATLNDSVNSNANKIKITNLESARELGLKEKQIEIDKLAIVKKRNERVFFIAGIMILLLVIVIILRNYYTQAKTNELLSKANYLLSNEKKRSDDLLRNILPLEVADELKATGSAVAKHFDHVTVMFTDFVNFTKAGERMNPQQLIEELHTCFKAFDEIIGKYNIEKIKTIGDAYLAVSGLPVIDTQHGEHIVRAAIDINTYMTKRKEQMGDKTFEVRIGIHSGSVVAGIVGVKKFAYDIWGDTVNTASRMEENSEAGKVNISQTTYELVKDKFVCIYRGEIEAKNKGELKMYFVEASRP
jgi:adenylate cyclase